MTESLPFGVCRIILFCPIDALKMKIKINDDVEDQYDDDDD